MLYSPYRGARVASSGLAIQWPLHHAAYAAVTSLHLHMLAQRASYAAARGQPHGRPWCRQHGTAEGLQTVASVNVARPHTTSSPNPEPGAPASR